MPTKKWEIIFADSDGEYHKAKGIQVPGVREVSFYKIGNPECLIKHSVEFLNEALEWDKDKKSQFRMSVRILKTKAYIR